MLDACFSRSTPLKKEARTPSPPRRRGPRLFFEKRGSRLRGNDHLALFCGFALILLAGCASAPEPPRPAQMEVVWLRVDDAQRACEGVSGRKEFFAVHGCSRWSTERKRCEIYAPPPRNERDLQRFATLGHELMHCFEGRWHDRWGRML